MVAVGTCGALVESQTKYTTSKHIFTASPKRQAQAQAKGSSGKFCLRRVVAVRTPLTHATGRCLHSRTGNWHAMSLTKACTLVVLLLIVCQVQSLHLHRTAAGADNSAALRGVKAPASVLPPFSTDPHSPPLAANVSSAIEAAVESMFASQRAKVCRVWVGGWMCCFVVCRRPSPLAPLIVYRPTHAPAGLQLVRGLVCDKLFSGGSIWCPCHHKLVRADGLM